MTKKNHSPKSASEKIPLAAYILLGLALLSGVILLIAKQSPSFAAFFNKYISGTVRVILAYATNLIPFSVAELLIILLPVMITVLVIYAIKRKAHSLKAIISYFVTLLAGASVIFSIFVFSFGVGYHVPTLYDRFDIANNGASAEELKQTATELAIQINRRTNGVDYTADGFSVMPYSLEQMNDLLIAAYNPINEKYTFVQKFSSNIKPVLMSVPMSYTHTTGIYTFFTGEANLNVDFPDYTLPYTAAHELAHQRGISRENEANFIAFLVGINSGDNYIEYSAYLNMFEYVASALYQTDSKMYNEVYALLYPSAKNEIAAYSKFYEKYRNSKVGEISSSINNAYLVANGTEEGTKSYGLVVDLTVAYFAGAFDEN